MSTKHKNPRRKGMNKTSGKDKQNSSSKNYVFTLNNYTEEEIFELSTLVHNITNKVAYICFGKEIGEEGTPHLQGYLEMKKKGMESCRTRTIVVKKM